MPLSLNARLAIRNWDDADGPVAKSLKALSDTLGRQVVCDPDWSVLYAALGETYPANSDRLITDTASLVQSWAAAACDILDNAQGETEKWADDLLEALQEAAVRVVSLLVEPGSTRTPGTQWDRRHCAFVLRLPTEQYLGNAVPVFTTGIMAALQSINSDCVPGDEWAEVSNELQDIAAPAKPSAVSHLPSVKSIPRPDDLLLRPPYHLHIYSTRDMIRIECSHSPSLALLEEYFKKWCRTSRNHSNKPPLVDIKLAQSPFGLGVVNDILILEIPDMLKRYGGTLSLPIVLHLVEGVLGYAKTYESASVWYYRRDAPFKDL